MTASPGAPAISPSMTARPDVEARNPLATASPAISACSPLTAASPGIPACSPLTTASPAAGMDRLTLERVQGVVDAWSGLQLMEEHRIRKDGCNSLNEIKERLRLHCQQQLGVGKTPEQAKQMLISLGETDRATRTCLTSLLGDVERCLRGCGDAIVANLVREGTLRNLRDDVLQRMHVLRSDECSILVLGETSAGKSSLLNLILGREVLPHRLLPCTSVICRIRYDTSVHASLIRHDGAVTHVDVDPRLELVTQLGKFIHRDQRSSRPDDYKMVDIYLPLDILRSGLQIIDSPGFGESAAMDAVLLDFISENPVFAFIYVVKSDNAGGVQQDRLQRILQQIISQQNEEWSCFDPTAAIFVCNRWDLVAPDDESAVKDAIGSRLASCWPDMQARQLFFISCTRAAATWQAGYVSNEYSDLLDGIATLLPVGLKRRVRICYKWCEALLARVVHQVGSYLARTRLSDRELQMRHRATEMRLLKLSEESARILGGLGARLDKQARQISARLSQFMQAEEARSKMTDWEPAEIVECLPDDTWQDIEPMMDEAIEKRLLNILRQWDTQQGLFRDVQEELFACFKEEFLLLDSQLSAISSYLQREDLAFESRGTAAIQRQTSILQAPGQLSENVPGAFHDLQLTSWEQITLGVSAPPHIPIACSFLVYTPILILWDFSKWRRRTQAAKSLLAYRSNPCAFMSERSLLVLDKLSDIELVSEYVFEQLRPARLYLDSMRKLVPKLMENTRTLMDSIVNDSRSNQQLIKEYSALETSLPQMQDRLAEFANRHIRQFDFQASQLRTLEPGEGGYRGTIRHRALYTELSKGVLSLPDKKVQCCIRTYHGKVSALHSVQEEAHLRRVRHPHVTRLIGTYRMSECGLPGFVLEQCLRPARSELFSGMTSHRPVLLPRWLTILTQTGMALEYLHGRGLVHMELSLDTIFLLSGQDHVKLTCIGEPRSAQLTEDTKVGMHVYLAPEVLRGANYQSRADVFALGVTAWELWMQELAFSRQRGARLADLIVTARTSPLKTPTDCPFAELIQRTVHTAPESRLNSSDAVNLLRSLRPEAVPHGREDASSGGERADEGEHNYDEGDS